MDDRRTSERIRLNLGARWESLGNQGRGSVADLSLMGCFILTAGEVSPGELIRLEILFPNEVASLWGEVVYNVAEMGFALRFKFKDEAARNDLERLLGLIR